VLLKRCRPRLLWITNADTNSRENTWWFNIRQYYTISYVQWVLAPSITNCTQYMDLYHRETTSCPSGWSRDVPLWNNICSSPMSAVFDSFFTQNSERFFQRAIFWQSKSFGFQICRLRTLLTEKVLIMMTFRFIMS